MKIVTVIGARPQFIKAASVSHLLRAQNTEILVHTGQHYDQRMSEVFFGELGIPQPDYNLEVGSAGHAEQTGEMLIRLEPIISRENPDAVLVYGDTNSTLSGALVASKLHIPVAHVEAGLRSFNREMPEEINRVLTDHISQLLFCPSQEAVGNLKQEGITAGIHVVGDVMRDAVLKFISEARNRSIILSQLDIEKGGYLLLTLHRPANVDDPETLAEIFRTLALLGEKIIFPVHPRTSRAISTAGIHPASNILLIDPVGYTDMLWLEKNARIILTDSGGIQKEAYWLSVPCITMRSETEWVETVQTGWNVVVGTDQQRILEAVRKNQRPDAHPPLYGTGQAAEQIVKCLGSL